MASECDKTSYDVALTTLVVLCVITVVLVVETEGNQEEAQGLCGDQKPDDDYERSAVCNGGVCYSFQGRTCAWKAHGLGPWRPWLVVWTRREKMWSVD